MAFFLQIISGTIFVKRHNDGFGPFGMPFDVAE
jgi:hypothetical protein